MFKKRGRPRLENPCHHYSLQQWKQHDDQGSGKLSKDERGAIGFLKKFGLVSLLDYSFSDLLKSVHGKKPKCFAMGDIDTLPQCQVCIKRDLTSETEGFFDLQGKEIAMDAYGVYCACWISTWIQHFKDLKIRKEI